MTRWLRVAHEGRAAWAEADGEELVVLDAAPWGGGGRTSIRLPRARATVLAPAAPSKVVCVGRNYKKHAAELGNDVPDEPLLFLKPPSSIIGPDAPIVRPRASALVHHEGELGVVVGTRLSRASLAQARESVFGFVCANDVTARDIQRREKRFTRAKGFDTFCPLGPELVDRDEISDPQALELVVRVGDEVRQRGSTAAMVFSIVELLAFASGVMTLEPGDVVLTGTPEGVGPLVAGDRVSVEVEGIGTLSNSVEDEPGGTRASE